MIIPQIHENVHFANAVNIYMDTFLGKPSAGIEAWMKRKFDKKGPLFFEANEPGASVAMLCWDDYNYQ